MKNLQSKSLGILPFIKSRFINFSQTNPFMDKSTLESTDKRA
ncbi:hypothetical protein [Helicobacter himalayensis]|nr:hypothetical protein [Helicobacter himalayensis]